jgi:hypothetical protein
MSLSRYGWRASSGAIPPIEPPGPQQSQSGRIVTLVSVQQGQVYVAPAGGTTWTPAINSTGNSLASSGPVRSASNNQKLWYADGSNWLYYDPSDNNVHNWTASAGTLPSSSGNTPRLICTWRGRTVLSGISTDPQNWFMSRIGNPTDWNYFPAVITADQPVAGNNSPLGMVGDVVTVLIPYSDDVLIMGGDHTIWSFAGDPMNGGQINNVSDAIGMAWGAPWARGPDGTLYFVSNQTGIYSMIPGEKPVRMSQQIEQLLTDINTGHNIIRMLWSDRFQGLHVFVTYTAQARASTHFFWEARTGAWWSDVFANTNHNPLCCCTFDGNTAADRRALIGSWDGYVRMLDPLATSDDGTPISSSVVVGPIQTREMDAVLFKDIQSILGASSGAVSYAVYVGSTAEVALASSAVASGVWSAGRSLTSPVRRSGHAIWVKLTSTSAWALEQIKLRIKGNMGRAQKRGA